MTTEDFPEHVAELALLAEKFEEHRPKLLAMLNNRMDPALRVRLDPDDILNEAFLRAKDRWHDCVQSGLPTYVWLRRLVMDCLKDKWDFHNIRRIAEGGMGIVYEAEQLSLGRRVALKIRRGRLSPRAHDRFLTEQKVMARLHQTHIVPIHTAGQDGPWQFIAMANIEGAPLSRVVEMTLKYETAPRCAFTPSLAEMNKKEESQYQLMW